MTLTSLNSDWLWGQDELKGAGGNLLECWDIVSPALGGGQMGLTC